jgi:TM2 domain-containing membrane protein YozV
MDCVNHSGVSATAYCQSCGKALCAGCVRNAAGGQILCEPCWITWQNYQQPFAAPPPRGPKPALAAFLGLFPGVGAMYNGQFLKGFIHVAIFVVLVSIANHFDVFGFAVAAWIIYQSFEAYHTAKAMRDGQPLPDPLGLNELGSRLNFDARPRYPAQPGAAPAQPIPDPPWQCAAGPAIADWQQTHSAQSQAPFTPPAAGFVNPAVPSVPPVPPYYWRRREPIGALVLIALGLLFLLDQLDIFNGRLFEFTWPVLLIALGVWLIVRRVRDSQGGSK